MVISSPFIKINEGFRYELKYRYNMDDHSPKLSFGCYRYISDLQIFNGNTTLVRNTLMDLL